MKRWSPGNRNSLVVLGDGIGAGRCRSAPNGRGVVPAGQGKNDATYRPPAEYLGKKLGREVKLFTVDTWEGLAKSLASGETDIALMGPWGYMLAHHTADAQVIATILY